MAGSTSRLALAEPVGADPVSELRISINNHASVLDAAIRVFEGTLSQRSSVTPAYGDEYEATDTGLTYKWNGTAWQTILVAGAWQPLTLQAGVTTGGAHSTASARLEGDVVRLTGIINAATGGTPAGTTFATLPSSTLYPLNHPGIMVGNNSLWITYYGTIEIQVTLAAGTPFYLDGMSYALS